MREDLVAQTAALSELSGEKQSIETKEADLRQRYDLLSQREAEIRGDAKVAGDAKDAKDPKDAKVANNANNVNKASNANEAKDAKDAGDAREGQGGVLYHRGFSERLFFRSPSGGPLSAVSKPIFGFRVSFVRCVQSSTGLCVYHSRSFVI